MSNKRKRYNLLDNIARLYRCLRGGPHQVEVDDGTWRFVGSYNPWVTDDKEVLAALDACPTHYSAHNQRLYESQAPWNVIDPFAGATNENSTTFGANSLEFTQISGQQLQSLVGSGTSGRTLKDPTNSSITFTMTLIKKSTVNLNVMGNIPWWLQATLSNFTQNGNFGIFSAVDQTLQVFSVPISKAAGATYTAVHNSPVTVPSFPGPPYRWCAVFSDGATVN